MFRVHLFRISRIKIIKDKKKTGPTHPLEEPQALPRSASAAIPLESALFVSQGAEDGASVTLVPLPKQGGVRLLPSDKQLAHLVQQMLEVEDPGEAEVLSPKEEYIIQTLRRSLQMIDGKYQVSCTWAPGSERPPLNLGTAQGRLRNLEKSSLSRRKNSDSLWRRFQRLGSEGHLEEGGAWVDSSVSPLAPRSHLKRQ